MSHRLHLLVFAGVHIELLWSKVSQLRILLLHANFLLTPCTLIEQISLEQPFKFHYNCWQVDTFKTLGEDFTKKTDDGLVEGNIIDRVILDDTFEFDKALDV